MIKLSRNNVIKLFSLQCIKNSSQILKNNLGISKLSCSKNSFRIEIYLYNNKSNINRKNCGILPSATTPIAFNCSPFGIMNPFFDKISKVSFLFIKIMDVIRIVSVCLMLHYFSNAYTPQAYEVHAWKNSVTLSNAVLISAFFVVALIPK